MANLQGRIHLDQLPGDIQGAHDITPLFIQLNRHDLHGIAFIHYILVITVNLGHIL